VTPTNLEPFTPPRNADGVVQPHDDPRLTADDYVIRYTSPNERSRDDTLGRYRISSGAYTESSVPPYGVSVQIERLLIAASLTAEQKAPSADHGIVRLRVGTLREMGFKVGYDPEPNNPTHGEIWGVSNTRRAKKIARHGEQNIVRLPNFPPYT
jgi:hypothetical protein